MIKEAAAGRRCLTTSQQRLVSDNIGLAYVLARKYKSPQCVTDELVGAAFEGLCLSAITWRKKRGPFARYAAAAIGNAVRQEVGVLRDLPIAEGIEDAKQRPDSRTKTVQLEFFADLRSVAKDGR